MAQNQQMEGISEVQTGEPQVSVTFPQANLCLPFLVNTGATYPAISSEFCHFQSSSRSMQVVDLSGQPSTCSFFSMVPISSLLKNMLSYSLL